MPTRKRISSGVRIGLVLIFCEQLVISNDLFAKPPLGKQWPASQQVSIDQINHSKFDRLLKKYVDQDGYVDYTQWHASSKDRRELRRYLQQLSRANVSQPATKSAKLAFWINAYNAVTIEGILQEYPTTSIRNHTAKLIGYNIWEDLPLIVGDRQFSLEEMEHAILRKMDEPKIHFAIVCASVSCPRLRNEAYTAEKLESQLQSNTKDFFSRKKNFNIHPSKNRVYLSSILSWFEEDFGGSQAAVLKWIRPYVPAAAQSLLSRNVTVSYIDYDWSLNDQKTKDESR